MSPRSEVPKNETRIIADRHSQILASKSQNWSSGPRPETRPATSTMKANSFFGASFGQDRPRASWKKMQGSNIEITQQDQRVRLTLDQGQRRTRRAILYADAYNASSSIYIYIYIYMAVSILFVVMKIEAARPGES